MTVLPPAAAAGATAATASRPPTSPRSWRPGARLVRRGVGAVCATAVVVLLSQISASAHVHVQPDSTVTGTDSALTFRVPNESDTAGTVSLKVTLPTDKPFLEVSTKPVPGWHVSTTEEPLPAAVVVDGTTITKAARTVTWTADGGAQIGPGQYQDFSISVGPLPAPGAIQLPVTQTYSDGTVVTWDQPTPASGAEPENPAPEFVVTAAEPTTTAAGTPTAATATAATTGSPDSAGVQAAAPPAATSSDTLARLLGGLGLLAGVTALAIALLATRRRPTGTTRRND